MRKTLAACFFLVACSSSAETVGIARQPVIDAAASDVAAEPAPSVCEPGKQEACTCYDGSEGAQRCSKDGSGWGDCVCAEAGIVDASTVDSSADTYEAFDVGIDTGSSDDPETGPDIDSAIPNQICDGHFEIVESGTGDCKMRDGTGLVLDTKTGLTWTRIAFGHCNNIGTCSGHPFQAAKAHCEALGKRLPTLVETNDVAGDNFSSCAFPCNWETWTDYSLKTGYEYVRFSSGEIMNMPETSTRAFLCVNP